MEPAPAIESKEKGVVKKGGVLRSTFSTLNRFVGAGILSVAALSASPDAQADRRGDIIGALVGGAIAGAVGMHQADKGEARQAYERGRFDQMNQNQMRGYGAPRYTTRVLGNQRGYEIKSQEVQVYASPEEIKAVERMGFQYDPINQEFIKYNHKISLRRVGQTDEVSRVLSSKLSTDGNQNQFQITYTYLDQHGDMYTQTHFLWDAGGEIAYREATKKRVN